MKIIVNGQEIDLSNAKTDSDIIDIAEQFDIPIAIVFGEINKIKTKGTPCEGCLYTAYRYNFHPCSDCSRKPDLMDRYKLKE